MEKAQRNAPTLLLGALLIAAAATIFVLTQHLTFFGDCWEFLMNRRDLSADAVFKPHNEHIVVVPVLIEQLFLRLFGMSSATPEFVLLDVALLGTAVLFFVYVRRRVGPWLALFATAIVLFLGPAFEVLLWTFEIGFVGSVFFGLAMLLALERGDRRGDLAACLFLAASFGFSSLGIPFAIGAAVAIGLGPRTSWRSRAFVFVVPVVLFALWYLGWGHDAESHLSLRNVLASPRYVAEAIAVAVASVVGLGQSPYGGLTDPNWGRAIVVVLFVALGIRYYRKPGVYRGVWPVAAIAAGNWFLSAFNQYPGRDPSASRYQYAACILVLMIAANLLKGVELSRRALLACAAVTVAIVAVNAVVLEDGRDFFAEHAALTRGDLAALEIARDTVDPELQLSPEIAGTPTLVDVSAQRFFEAADEYGSPAYTPAELLGAPPNARKYADVVLGQALPVSTATEPGAYDAAAAGCVEAGGAEAPLQTEVPVGETRIEVAPGGPASFSLRRFAQEGESPILTSGAPGDSETTLTIPPDRATQPWFLHVEADQPVLVCPN